MVVESLVEDLAPQIDEQARVQREGVGIDAGINE